MIAVVVMIMIVACFMVTAWVSTQPRNGRRDLTIILAQIILVVLVSIMSHQLGDQR